MKNKNKGYSLLELLVVLSIVAILMMSASYQLSGSSRQHELTVEKTKLLSFLDYAREYAVLHHVSVTVCGSGVMSLCDGAWSKEWLLFANQRLKLRSVCDKPLVNIRWKGSFGQRKQLQFDPFGFARGAHGRFILSANGANKSLTVIVSPSGILR